MVLLDRLHARLGDFWWYSLMLFCAMRAADCMNVFVGLYLVPKYVDPSELGAVMPLTQFAGCLALPIAIFATTFRNEIVNLAAEKRFGQLKTLLRGTFIATGVFLVLAIVVCWLVLPAYLERMRLAKGSLGVLIVVLAFVTSVSPIFGNALQALKKFRATSVIGILGAPIRLVSMALVLPLRPISGYFAGQASTPAFGILASLFALRKELAVKSEPYWNRGVFRRVARFATLTAIGSVSCACWTLVSNTILRQRLPELDSAAFYMATRFSEISGFVSMTLIFTMFPFTASLAREGKSTNPLVIKASTAMIAFCIPLALLFSCWGDQMLLLLPHGTDYSPYAWITPWAIGISCLNAISSFHIGTETSAERFGYLWWSAPLNIAFAVTLLAVTGHGYFTNHLPVSVTRFLSDHNVTTISAYLMWSTVFELVRILFCAIDMIRLERRQRFSINSRKAAAP